MIIFIFTYRTRSIKGRAFINFKFFFSSKLRPLLGSAHCQRAPFIYCIYLGTYCLIRVPTCRYIGITYLNAAFIRVRLLLESALYFNTYRQYCGLYQRAPFIRERPLMEPVRYAEVTLLFDEMNLFFLFFHLTIHENWKNFFSFLTNLSARDLTIFKKIPSYLCRFNMCKQNHNTGCPKWRWWA